MPSISIMNIDEHSAILPENSANILHERKKRVDILTFRNADGQQVRSFSEMGSSFIIITNET